MSLIKIIGNGNKSLITEDFPKCKVKKTWLLGYKWQVQLGGAKSEGSIDNLSNSFFQQFNGVTISGSPSKYSDSFCIVVSYKGRIKTFSIQGGKITEG